MRPIPGFTIFLTWLCIFVGLFMFFWLDTKYEGSLAKKSYDYQLEVHNDTLWLYNADGTLVNKCIDTIWNSPLMEIIKLDNK